MYDLAIIGAGPAGITAAIYAARRRINFCIISKDIGGQALWSSDVENYPGHHHLAGVELMQKFEEHMDDYKIDQKIPEEAAELAKEGNKFRIKTNEGEYESKAVLITAGKKPRKLGIPGEEKYERKGVAYCAICDAPLFSGMDVAVIGGGNSALDAALQLKNIASKVYLININPSLMGEDVMIENVEKAENIEILNSTETLEVLGDKMVNGLKIKQNREEKQIEVKGVFVEIGLVTNIGFLKEGFVGMNKQKEVIVDKEGRTNVEGLFAAGDITDIAEKQIVVACGEGCKAALQSFAYIERWKG